MNRLAEIGDCAGRRFGQTGNQAQQSRFARAGAAEQADDLALRERQLDAVEHQMLAAIGARKRLAERVNVEEGGGHSDPHPSRNLRSA